MKIAIITDQHIGVRNSNILFLDYYEEFHSKVFFPYLKEHNIDTVINAGDILDNRKTTNVLTMDRFHRMWIDPLVKNGYTEHALVGNHNTYYRNTNEINSLNPIYSQHDKLHLYESDPKEVMIGGTLFGMVPWICPENKERCLEFIKNTRATILIGHFEIAGFQMDGNFKCETGISMKEFRRFDYVFSGHFHKKQCIGNIHYLGSPYDMSFTDLGETKGFHVFDTDTQDLEFIPHNKKRFFRLYYDDVNNEYDFSQDDFSDMKNGSVRIVVLKKTNNNVFESLISSLEESEIHKISIVDKVDDETIDLDGVDMSLPTIEIINREIDKLEGAEDQHMMKEIVSKIYTEAMNI